MAEDKNRIWAKITSVGVHSLLAQTQEGEYVFIWRKYGRMLQVGRDDIISFIPATWKGESEFHGVQLKWYATSPWIIGKHWHGRPKDQSELHVRRGSHEDIPYEEAFREPVNTPGEVCSTNASHRE